MLAAAELCHKLSLFFLNSLLPSLPPCSSIPEPEDITGSGDSVEGGRSKTILKAGNRWVEGKWKTIA
ncbi:hypothetical protein ACFX2I_014825 [Malus domestica]